MSEDSIREVSEQSELEVSPKHLRESIFIACDRLQTTGKKISRPVIRAQVGKISNRDLDKYINEWKESKESQSLVHGSINQDAIVETIPEEVQNINLNRHSQREQITQMGAKLASEMLIGESIVASYLLQNPDKLPDEFQKKVQQARAQLDGTINQVFQLDADLEEIAQLAIASLQIGEQLK